MLKDVFGDVRGNTDFALRTAFAEALVYARCSTVQAPFLRLASKRKARLEKFRPTRRPELD